MRMHRAIVVAFCCLLGILVAGCERPRCPDARRPLDQKTVAILQHASTLHHKADTLEAMSRYDEAHAAIESILQLAIPMELLERTEIRQDAWARLAEIDLARAQPQRALESAEKGLLESPVETVMLARVYDVKGRALRALSQLARQEGREADVSKLQLQAVEAFDRAITINQRVLGLDADGGST